MQVDHTRMAVQVDVLFGVETPVDLRNIIQSNLVGAPPFLPGQIVAGGELAS